MTYNIHGGVGRDGRLDIERTAEVVRAARPDLLAIQEVDVARKRSGRIDQARELAERFSLRSHFTCAVREGDGQYGIALLTSSRLGLQREGCLPFRRDEARAAQWARLDFLGFDIDVVHTHLSIRAGERQTQLDALLGNDWVAHRLGHPHLLVCGDLNALPLSRVHRTLSRVLTDVQRRRPGRNRATWPAWAPVARIDHIFVGHGFRVAGCDVPKNPLTRAASDHLPVVADLELVVATSR